MTPAEARALVEQWMRDRIRNTAAVGSPTASRCLLAAINDETGLIARLQAACAPAADDLDAGSLGAEGDEED